MPILWIFVPFVTFLALITIAHVLDHKWNSAETRSKVLKAAAEKIRARFRE